MTNFFPSKHTRGNESIVGIGALLLKHLESPKSPDELWSKLKGERVPDSITFDLVLLAIDFLYGIGAVKITEEGLLSK